MATRGNISHEQLRSSSRQGDGAKVQMFGGGTPTTGNLAVYDANGNVTDGGPVAGTIGPSGPSGPSGPAGPSGPSGPAGVTGPSGPAGPSGTAGTAGAAGPSGPSGPAGPSGTTGSAGAAGPSGPSGPSGPAGSAGSAGPSGPSGPAGATGPSGPSGPSGPAGTGGSGGFDYYDQALVVPVYADFTVTDSAGFTSSTNGIAVNGGNNLGMQVYTTTAYTSTPITVVMAFIGFIWPESFAEIELFAFDSVSGKAVSYGYQYNGSPSIIGQKFNVGGGFNANYFSNTINGGGPFGPSSQVFWLRFKDDGSNRTFSVSPDGQIWSQVHSVGRTDFCTPNHFGWSIYGSSAHQPCCRVVHWKVN